MDAWSKYKTHGIWGLWCSYFAALPSGFALALRFGSTALLFSAQQRKISHWGGSLKDAVFQWASGSGLEIALFAQGAVERSAADCWQILLHYESRQLDSPVTFMPFVMPVGPMSQEINSWILDPPHTLLVSGQPGTGKSTILTALSLLHAQLVLPQSSESVILLGDQRLVVPEVALLEPAEQQSVMKHIKAGGVVWSATAYDLNLLKSRQILTASLADALGSVNKFLPPIAKRDGAELSLLADFWQSFHGLEHSKTFANLDFHKRRILGLASLSVESILEEGRGLRGVIAEFEKEAIKKAHARAGRSQHRIAGLLKVSRGSLQHKLRKYQLESYAPSDADTDTSE